MSHKSLCGSSRSELRNVTGVVTAKDKYGVWILSEASDDVRVSNGLRVYGWSISKLVNIGDMISLSGKVSEYRANASPNDLFLTELASPQDVTVISRDNVAIPIVIGKDRIPPTGSLTALDKGADGWLSVPNNVTLLEPVNATLQPDLYGLDFWESLEGQLVAVQSPVAASFPDRFGSIWVYGDWPVTGKNTRGGLTITFSETTGIPHAHPETILIGRPFDGARNPSTSIGATLTDITGIVTYQYGYYYILPLTAPKIISVPEIEVPTSSLTSTKNPCEITIGDYNVDNMSRRSRHLTHVAEHVADYLHSPDVLFVQEIQDDSGSSDDGTVSAAKTLTTLVSAIKKASGGVHYAAVDIDPENNMDGGKPGGNIRVAYLWRPDKVSPVPGSPIGKATEATEVLVDEKGKLSLTLNPGRVNPTNSAWEETRKPLAAAWQTTSGERFITVNVHFSSKRDSSSAQGDARPPVNGVVERRSRQVDVIANFVESILIQDVNASIIIGGDMNEYIQTRTVFAPFVGLLTDINDAAGVPQEERYTYVYDQNMQEIDHVFLSAAVARRAPLVEHVHVNTWAASLSARASDHDPSVAKVWVCEPDNEDASSDSSIVLEYTDYVEGQLVL
ncbi:hypothetical protein SCP_1200160 [Sparassis crispa]|uniref:Endonuclease/exonuclease/phosphatase domain-containing protein n=1 Tax=Sparassis crispa TaxID=139825 RepID=A0A401H067_9APHY|nr:hypothetical protein SCP_1200160 [Sparassis crispa]GBE87792.1 hypothetical protein SCP_1200160 [Sparassis crispa]